MTRQRDNPWLYVYHLTSNQNEWNNVLEVNLSARWLHCNSFHYTVASWHISWRLDSNRGGMTHIVASWHIKWRHDTSWRLDTYRGVMTHKVTSWNISWRHDAYRAPWHIVASWLISWRHDTNRGVMTHIGASCHKSGLYDTYFNTLYFRWTVSPHLEFIVIFETHIGFAAIIYFRHISFKAMEFWHI